MFRPSSRVRAGSVRSLPVLPASSTCLARRPLDDPRGRVVGAAAVVIGRKAIGTGPGGVESVRLEPELRSAPVRRAERDHEGTSSVIREALREYLKAS
jgi:hypothetical protein